MRPTTKLVADWINEDCDNCRYFWAAGLVKESIELWEKRDNFMLLGSTAQIMAEHYLEEV